MINQEQITADGKPFEHPLTERSQPASIFDRAQPQFLLQAACRERARHAASFGRLELGRVLI